MKYQMYNLSLGNHKRFCVTISTSCFTDVCFILAMNWTCVGVHFIFDSYLLHLVFSLCIISQHLMQQQRLPYVFLISSLLFPQGHLSLFSWSLGIYSCSAIYHPTSAPFPPSSGMDHTLFQSSINQRTKPFIPHQSHEVLNNNPYGVQQPRVCIVALLLENTSCI